MPADQCPVRRQRYITRYYADFVDTAAGRIEEKEGTRGEDANMRNSARRTVIRESVACELGGFRSAVIANDRSPRR